MHKVAFQIGDFVIAWYGILVAVGFLAGLWTASRRAPLHGIAPETVADLGTWLIVGTIIGARAWYVAVYWNEQFAHQPLWHVVMVREGGLVFYGGLIGAVCAGAVFVAVRRVSFWPLADVFAPSIALGHVFGRVGCLMTGCCHGHACSWPWAIRFPADHATAGVPVHPTQLYEAALNLALYGALAWRYRRRRFEGDIFATYLAAYAVLRFGVEWFRGDYSPSQFTGPFTPGQTASLVLLAIGTALWIWLKQRTRGPGQAAARS